MIEYAGAIAKGRRIWLDHAECPVDGPEDEEEYKQMMRVPKSLVICTSSLLPRRDDHDYQHNEHDVPRPARPRGKVRLEESLEAKLILDCKLSEVVPVGNRVYKGECDDGPSNNCKG